MLVKNLHEISVYMQFALYWCIEGQNSHTQLTGITAQQESSRTDSIYMYLQLNEQRGREKNTIEHAMFTKD